MPPDRGRASQACTACRKQKTRCYETTVGRPCLRCERLGQECSHSFQSLSGQNEGRETLMNNIGSDSNRSADERFEFLEGRCNNLESIIKSLACRLDDIQRKLPSQSTNPIGDSHGQIVEPTQPELRAKNADQPPPPLFVLRDATTQSGIRPTEGTATNTQSRGLSDDIIIKGLVNEQNALNLLALFQEHYGRWVSFSTLMPTPRLLDDVRRSPLLLSACCLIAVRHSTQELAIQLAPRLFREVKTLLSTAMLAVPQPIEFFQASLVLSMWSTTIGQVPLSIDSWLLSGFALQHSIASGIFSIVGEGLTLSKRELDRLCIWNHLCLVHLHYCVGTRRKAVLDRKDVDRCRLVVGSDYATNFELRMVSEVYLYWIIYESFNTTVDLPRTQAALHAWKDEWSFLLEQPRSQFVQMGFYFAKLLVYDQSLKARSAAVRESLLSEMIRLSTGIMNLAMDTTDERTRHLTDHIYHMISFAAVTLCRLLHNYEAQLSSSHDLHGLDSLILSLVSWLHAIGLPSHVAHTMGDVVAAFHKRLRPEIHPSPSSSYADVDPAIQDDFAQLFPELFGPVSFDAVDNSMLPEFQPVL
ncbi:hypothetical protein CC78DRAFT_134379 [Lojkania enalia]|uniref:Transcriptional activator of proteases prtT n=1 Tax=Lojkania enalia TaxID=147567 RepID=A0A9P4NC39_9PLEO|nr:hypothetical protein CC78DRAFT_134379 [Didymosphaeria enalia]